MEVGVWEVNIECKYGLIFSVCWIMVDIVLDASLCGNDIFSQGKGLRGRSVSVIL